MTKFLLDALGHERADLARILSDLEDQADNPSLDIRLTMKTRESTKKAIKKLGLDPKDTNSKELYFALRHKLEGDNNRIAEMVGVSPDDSPLRLNQKIIKHINDKVDLPKLTHVKSASLKKALKKQPPKSLIKAQGRRSIDSMLKRENLAEVVALAGMIDGKWQARFHKELEKISPSDIEESKLRIQQVSQTKLNKIDKTTKVSRGHIITVNELGRIIVIPAAKRYPSDVIATIGVLIEALREIKLVSSRVKAYSVKKDFGKKTSRLIKKGSKSDDKVLPIGWNAMVSYAYRNRILPDTLGPHIAQEDVDIPPSVETLCLVFPDLEFWFDQGSSILVDDSGAVSCNLIDTILNHANNQPFEEAGLEYARRSLSDELLGSYLDFPEIQTKFIQI